MDFLVSFFSFFLVKSKKNSVEWSSNQFETIIGCVEMTNMCAKHEFLIERLESEQCYQVRIASGNCKGYSEYCYPLMNQSVPSSKFFFVLQMIPD